MCCFSGASAVKEANGSVAQVRVRPCRALPLQFVLLHDCPSSQKTVCILFRFDVRCMGGVSCPAHPPAVQGPAARRRRSLPTRMPLHHSHNTHESQVCVCRRARTAAASHGTRTRLIPSVPNVPQHLSLHTRTCTRAGALDSMLHGRGTLPCLLYTSPSPRD